MRYLAWILLALGGCSSPQKTVSGPISLRHVFPYGNYQHHVALQIPGAAKNLPRRFEFNGVVQTSEDAIRIAVLSAFGTTAFKINEDRRSGEIKAEIYVDGMKQYEPRLRAYYSTLRLLLLAENPPPARSPVQFQKTNAQGFPLEATVLKEATLFRFSDYDAHGIPGRIAIEHPQFQVEIEVSGYEI